MKAKTLVDKMYVGPMPTLGILKLFVEVFVEDNKLQFVELSTNHPNGLTP